MPADSPAETVKLAGLNSEIEKRARAAEAQLSRFQQQLGSWPPAKGAVSQDLASEVDRFLNLLEQGMTALRTQTDARIHEIQELQSRIAAEIGSLARHRKGVGRYRSGAKTPRLLNSQA